MNDLTPAEATDRLRELKQRIAGVDATIGRESWHRGDALREIATRELWRYDGASSWAAWLAAHDIDPATAWRNQVLVENFTAEMAARFGARKLAAAVAWLEATAREERVGDILSVSFRRRTPKGKFESVPFAKAPAALIEEAVRELRNARIDATRRRADAQIGGSLTEQVDRLMLALPAPPRGTVRGRRVAVKPGKDGRLAISFQGIPLDELDAFVAALAAHRLTPPPKGDT